MEPKPPTNPPPPPLLYLRSYCRPMLQTYNFNIENVWSVNNLDIYFFFWNKHLSKYQTLCPSFEGKDIWPLRLFKWLDTWPLQSTILDIFLFYWNKIILYFWKNTSKNQTLCPSFEGKHIWPLTSLNDSLLIFSVYHLLPSWPFSQSNPSEVSTMYNATCRYMR